MSNLGGYQTLVTIVKKVGGPKVFTALVVAVPVVTRSAEAGLKKAVRVLKKRSAPCETKGQVFRVLSDGEDASGLKLRVGDEYRVLECDGDAILVEVLGGAGNPYFLSSQFLRSISDFPPDKA